jgi:hypothetical protein
MVSVFHHRRGKNTEQFPLPSTSKGKGPKAIKSGQSSGSNEKHSPPPYASSDTKGKDAIAIIPPSSTAFLHSDPGVRICPHETLSFDRSSESQICPLSLKAASSSTPCTRTAFRTRASRSSMAASRAVGSTCPCVDPWTSRC